jgi:hypothetical protein
MILNIKKLVQNDTAARFSESRAESFWHIWSKCDTGKRIRVDSSQSRSKKCN